MPQPFDFSKQANPFVAPVGFPAVVPAAPVRQGQPLSPLTETKGPGNLEEALKQSQFGAVGGGIPRVKHSQGEEVSLTEAQYEQYAAYLPEEFNKLSSSIQQAVLRWKSKNKAKTAPKVSAASGRGGGVGSEGGGGGGPVASAGSPQKPSSLSQAQQPQTAIQAAGNTPQAPAKPARSQPTAAVAPASAQQPQPRPSTTPAAATVTAAPPPARIPAQQKTPPSPTPTPPPKPADANKAADSRPPAKTEKPKDKETPKTVVTGNNDEKVFNERIQKVANYYKQTDNGAPPSKPRETDYGPGDRRLYRDDLAKWGRDLAAWEKEQKDLKASLKLTGADAATAGANGYVAAHVGAYDYAGRVLEWEDRKQQNFTNAVNSQRYEAQAKALGLNKPPQPSVPIPASESGAQAKIAQSIEEQKPKDAVPVVGSGGKVVFSPNRSDDYYDKIEDQRFANKSVDPGSPADVTSIPNDPTALPPVTPDAPVSAGDASVNAYIAQHEQTIAPGLAQPLSGDAAERQTAASPVPAPGADVAGNRKVGGEVNDDDTATANARTTPPVVPPPVASPSVVPPPAANTGRRHGGDDADGDGNPEGDDTDVGVSSQPAAPAAAQAPPPSAPAAPPARSGDAGERQQAATQATNSNTSSGGNTPPATNPVPDGSVNNNTGAPAGTTGNGNTGNGTGPDGGEAPPANSNASTTGSQNSGTGSGNSGTGSGSGGDPGNNGTSTGGDPPGNDTGGNGPY